MTKHRIFTTKVWILIILIALVAEYILITNGTADIESGVIEPLQDHVQDAIMENAIADFAPVEDVQESSCPAKMQAEEQTENDGVYILVRTAHHDFELNL